MIQKIISDLIKKDQIKRQGQAAGRRDLNCQQTLGEIKCIFN
jgi:hypothetical protein